MQNICQGKQYEDNQNYAYEYFQSKLNQLDKVRLFLVQFNLLPPRSITRLSNLSSDF